MLRRVLRATALFLLCSALVPAAVLVTILATFVFAPLPATLPDPKVAAVSQISRVLDADGREIGTFRRFEQSIPVRREDIPKVLKQAVIAAEDQSFYSHGGVDVRGSLRALLADIRNKKVVQGGSTITQQYVKTAYTSGERTVVRKVYEAILASQLDRQVEKDDILYSYLSGVYLGEGAYGVGAASETYFRKPVTELNVSEAATLAGLIPAPSRYEPRGNPTLAEQKRLIVLGKLREQNRITQAEFDEALPQKIHLASSGAAKGPATVVHPPQQQMSAHPYFVDYVRRYLTAKYGDDVVFQGGLTVQTTLDSDLQAAAEAAVGATTKRNGADLEMALVAVEPPTGYVKALVGGRDFVASQVNLALGACPGKPTDPLSKIEVQATCWEEGATVIEGGGSGRQTGSSWKPFVLAAAYAKGFSPDKVYAAPSVYRIPGCAGSQCEIHNNEGGGGGSATLKSATAASINTVYAQLIRDVGIKETAEMAKKLGISSAWFSPREQGLSYALGVQEVAPLEMAAAFGVFANRGTRLPPTPVLLVRDATGKVLEDNSEPKGDRVVEEAVADNVTDALRGVITGGTAKRADIGRPAAGKTGTSQNFANAWFVGYTPTLSTSVWIGHPKDQKTPLYNIRGPAGERISRVYGGTIPAATWKSFMTAALKDVPVTEFSEPAPIKPIADALRRQQRGGIDPGGRRNPAGTDAGGPYLVGPKKPVAVAPVPTTIADSPGDEGGGGGRGTTSTTSTTTGPTRTTLVPP